MKKKISALILVMMLVFSCLSVHAEPTGFADVLLSVDYGNETTYVIGHKSPDSDTVCSAIVLRRTALTRSISFRSMTSGQKPGPSSRKMRPI